VSQTSTESLLELEDVMVQFGGESLFLDAVPNGLKDRFGIGTEPIRAVDGVSLNLMEEDVLAVVGESGSGKTTLGKIAAGLQRPTEGSVKYRNHDIWEVSDGVSDDDILFEELRKNLQIVHQDPDAALNPYRSVMKSLHKPLKLCFSEMSSEDRRQRILALFDTCGLTPVEEYESRYPHELSGGEKQRVVLIRAMLTEPDFILADEPVSALDPSLRISMLDLMMELQDMFGTSYLFISHNLENARYIAGLTGGRIAIMYHGEVVEKGPVEEVIQNPKHPYTQALKWASLPSDPDEARVALEDEVPLRAHDTPDLANPPTGCRFHPRCPKAREVCTADHPNLMSSDDSNHENACFREIQTHEYWDSEPLEGEEREVHS